MTTNKQANRLIDEKSPYLLQHAYNPVDWYPWGKEAFEKAERENKPVFLSIGYSTCHWCHVMENESFENEETADILNKYFISIKVDREERPDVDSVYMSVCTSLIGSGGWPLTIIMTPSQKPFYAGTYLPKSSRYGMTGLDDLLIKIARLWIDDKAKLVESAEEISDFIKNQQSEANRLGTPDKKLIMTGASILKKNHDRKYGGFGSAPKFPTPHNLLFLMHYSLLEKDDEAFEVAEKTLEQMYRGGIFDHVGGGFSRYSTDAKWLVPHFEKMLYDNALLICAFLEAYKINKRELYSYAAKKTLAYVIRELTDEKGGFYCGQDADSEGVEGKYYVFTPKEISKVLTSEEAELFCEWFDIDTQGNFEGKSIPNLLKNESFETVNTQIEGMFERLYSYRLNRTVLRKDDKILTSWNGLMIFAFATAYDVLNDEMYLVTAKKAYDFIEKNLTKNDGRLKVRWRDGHSAGEGTLDDYAFLALSLLKLYDVTFEVAYLIKACKTAKAMVEHFFDYKNGGFYLYANDAEKLLSRPKEIYDGAMPSGNSVAAYVLERLFSLTADNYWQSVSEKQMSFLAGGISTYPAGYSFSLLAMTRILYDSKNLICILENAETEKELTRFLKDKSGQPIDTLVINPENADDVESISPFVKQYPKDGKTTFYVCKNKACFPPVHDFKAMTQLLQ